MVVFANAKINVGLNIISKREDGFHNLETVFYPVDLYDIIEFIEYSSPGMEFSGIPVPGNPLDNLCVQAWQLLNKYYHLPPVKIFIHKNIPVGAGLGGGSSDAAFMLKGLNDKFNIGLSENQLEDYASRLGSDCAFFIKNKPVFAEGRGDIFKPVKVDLSGYHIIIIKPDIHVNTGMAYASVKPQKSASNLLESVTRPIESWRDLVVNDFENGIFELYPEIKSIKQTLIGFGASYASMSGSGSSVYGIFKDPIPQELLQKYSGSFIWTKKTVR